MAELYRFAAFISYSSKDAAFARKLHQALEAYAIPASLGAFDLVGAGRKNRIYPVFRDREELPSGDLGEAIAAALKASNALIIICSPHAAASPWVNKEIESFIALGRRDRIFAILHPEAPNTDDKGADATALSFPPAFRGEGLEGGLEPIAGDARPTKDGFRNAWLKVVAGLIGVHAGALQDRERRRQRTRMLRAGIAAAAATASLGVAGAWVEAQSRREILANWPAQSQGEGDAVGFALAAAGEPGALLAADHVAATAVLAAKARAPIVRTVARLAPMERIEIAPQETRFAVWGLDGRIRVWPMAHGPEPLELERPGAPDNFAAMTFTDDDSALLVRSDWMDAETRGDPDGGRADLVRFAAPGEMSTRRFTQARLVDVSANGARLSVKERGGRAVIYDLRTPDAPLWQVPPADQNAWLRMSPNGQRVLLDGRDSALAVWSFTENAAPVRRDLPGRFEQADVRFHGGGDFLSVRPLDEKAHTRLFDLRSTAAPFDIGRTSEILDTAAGVLAIKRPESGADLVTLYPSPSQITMPPVRDMRLSADRRRLVIETPDGMFAAIDFAPGKPNVIAMGKLGAKRWTLAGDGAFVAVETEEAGIAIYPVAADAKAIATIPAIDDMRGFKLANGGARLFITRRDQPALAMDISAAGARREIASSNNAEMTNDGAYAFAYGQDGLVQQVDLTQVLPAPAGATSQRYGQIICATQAGHVRPFQAQHRTAQSGETARVAAALRGRPWNPCDWRGLFAFTPNAAHGDGWLEGPRQFLRLMHVRYFGGKDYACGDTLTRASAGQKAQRQAMCRFAEQKISAE